MHEEPCGKFLSNHERIQNSLYRAKIMIHDKLLAHDIHRASPDQLPIRRGASEADGKSPRLILDTFKNVVTSKEL